MEFTIDNNGETLIGANVTPQFILKLSENGSTGYRWEIKELPEGICLLDTSLIKPKHILAGAASTRVFYFSNNGNAEGTLSLQYYRVWNKDDIALSFLLKFKKE